nr:DUF202 domain-containing protein [Motilibacter rhizosphaerae]
MSLAAERTYLAYVRTGLALLAAGMGVAAALPDAGAEALRRALGLFLLALGGTVLAAARPRWNAVDRAMRQGDPLPRAPLAAYVGYALVAAAVAGAVVVVVG